MKLKLLINKGIIILFILTLISCTRNPEKIESLYKEEHHNNFKEELVVHSLPELKNWEWAIEPYGISYISFINENMIKVVTEDDRLFIQNLQTKNLCFLEYDDIFEFVEGIARAKKEGSIFYVNNQGDALFDMSFEDGLDVSESLIAVKSENKWGYIEKNGNVIIDFEYEEAKSFIDGLAIVKKQNFWGVIDKLGNEIIKPEYLDMHIPSEGLIAVKSKDGWGFIDYQGNNICPMEYQEVRDFHEGYAAVCINNKWGYIDINGNLSIECMYDAAHDFSESLAAVMKKDSEAKWGYIDYNNNVKIDFYNYEASDGRVIYVGDFNDGKAFVTKTLYTIIDKSGNEIYNINSEFFIHDFTYFSMLDAIKGYVYSNLEMTIRKYGLVNLQGKIRLEPIFKNILEIKGEYVIVEIEINNEAKVGVLKMKSYIPALGKENENDEE